MRTCQGSDQVPATSGWLSHFCRGQHLQKREQFCLLLFSFNKLKTVYVISIIETKFLH